MIKDIVVNGRPTKVFILKETSEATIFIPIKSLNRVDYNRLKEMSEKGRGDLLETMRDTKLDNGRYALSLYQSIIQTIRPEKKTVVKEQILTEKEVKETPKLSEETPVKRRPGRPRRKATT